MPPERVRSRVDRIEFVYTLQGEPLVRCFLAPTTEGFLFGISHPSVGDIHLTAFLRDGKIRTHIKDSAHDPAYVHDRTFTPDILARKLAARLRRFVRTYRPNMVAWVMRPALKRKLSAALDFPSLGGAVHVPLEVVKGYVLADLQNHRRWRRVRIRDLLKMPGELGVRVEKGRPYLVRPLDGRIMLKLTAGQAEGLDRLVLEYLGFEEYADYVKATLDERKPNGSDPSSLTRGLP